MARISDPTRSANLPDTEPAPEYRVGIDIGGTFTDLTLADATGIVAVGKTLTTPEQPALGVDTVLRETLDECEVAPDQVQQVIHGTTLVTNALIERKGSRTALLATMGFRDVIEMARERRYELYDLMIDLPQPLVPRHLRFGVPERVLADGRVEEELDVEYVERVARELAAAGIEAVAIAFLHSYRNPSHEQLAREAVERAAPGLRVAISAEVVPEMREYERTSTTVASVYVQDRVDRYLKDLSGRLARLGVGSELHVMLSNGGIATVETAVQHPIRLLESGPAAGALAAAAFGQARGFGELLSFDMGGTTAKLCVIEAGEPLVSSEFEVDRVYRLTRGSGLPIKTPVIDMIEIGVGGGSIARVDSLGLLRLGPDSAGSDPGPACYGRGGTQPTVTDADLVLGYLDPDYFLGGRMRLDHEAAREAIEQRVAQPLGVTVEQAAWGIHRGVNEDMANAARVHAVERGKDPTNLALVTFGGAGPVHGVGVGRALAASTLIVPSAAGVMSSAGFLTAPLAFDFVRSIQRSVGAMSADEAEAIFGAMEDDGNTLLERSGVAPADVVHARWLDMRYAGQGFDVRVPLVGVDRPWPHGAIEAFERRYHQLYGRRGPDVNVEVVNWRVVSSGPKPDLRLGSQVANRNGEPCKGSRSAWFAGERLDMRVYDRYGLRPGDELVGPAAVEERESTLVLPQQTRCRVGSDLALEIDLRTEPG